MVVDEKRKFSKIPKWRHYLLKTRAKRKKDWQNHWEWLNKPFQNASSHGNDSEARKLGFVRVEAERCWTAFLCLWTLFQRQNRKGFLHCIVTGDEKWVHYNNSKRRKSYTVKNETVENYPLHDNRVLGRCEILTSVKIHCNATCYFILAM